MAGKTLYRDGLRRALLDYEYCPSLEYNSSRRKNRMRKQSEASAKLYAPDAYADDVIDNDVGTYSPDVTHIHTGLQNYE